MLYNWAADNAESVSCIAGIYPVCNLASYPGFQRACGAYDLTADQLESSQTEHNPLDRLQGLAKAKVPIFHLHGDKDQVVPLEANSLELANRYRKLGGPVKLEIIQGQGHNMWTGWFESKPLVDFLIANVTAGTTANPEK